MTNRLPSCPRLVNRLTGWIATLLIVSTAYPQPGPLDTIVFTIPAGTIGVPTYYPFAVSYYPFHNGLPTDSVQHILGTQLVGGTTTTADRVIDITFGGFAYRDASGNWQGSLSLLRNKRAFMIMNRHEERQITLVGCPADTITYISPMPNGSWRTAGPRMLRTHSIDSVGLITFGFHKSQSMKSGGDLILDMVTRKIARCDSTNDWIGTMQYLEPGHPVIIQVNHPLTFDWTYGPGMP